jgi:hypothetical protein
MKLKFLFGLLILLLGALPSFAQSSSVTGVVRDAVSKKGVEGVAVLLTGRASPAGRQDSLRATTDAQGKFTIASVKPGRYICSVRSLAYESDQQETLVNTGKTTVVEFILQEKITELETTTIQARPTNTTEPGSISLPIEKVMRMPANFFDPVRMLTSYPGVVGTNDQANNIVVKGNSPTGLLWRLNGMDIVNPNHLANAGTFNDKPTANGGGVNILSAQMLDRTDFYSGAMPARYGNLSAAALDMTLRNGNSQKQEFTAQASLIGLDFAAEGPLGKKGRTTYVANARYSTVGLLSNIGVDFSDEKINFYDLSFNVNTLIGNRGGNISFFGFGGRSTNDFKAKDSSEWETDKDRFNIYYKNNTYAVGTRLDLPLKKSFTFSSGVTYSSNEQSRNASTGIIDSFEGRKTDFKQTRKLISAFASITGKLSSKLSGEFGAMVNHNEDYLMDSLYLVYFDVFVPQSNFSVQGRQNYTLFQPYGELTFRVGKFSAKGGVRYLQSTYKKTSVDPRINLQLQLTPSSNIYVTGGQMSQMLPVGVSIAQTNKDFLRKYFVEAGHIIQLENWKLNSSVYYHEYRNAFVSTTSNFSALNYVEGTITEQLSPTGSGINKGIALQAERSFVDGYYLLAGASVYRSLYTDFRNIERPTKFDGRYSLMVTGGREWTKVVDENNRSFGIHGRMMYLGGLRDTPIDEQSSRTYQTTVYTQNANSITLNDYVRLDLRLSWRKNKKNYTRTIALDVQNVAGIKNQAYKYYDSFQGKVVTQYQVGFIPVLVYRVDF